jgi:hypothetical protein
LLEQPSQAHALSSIRPRPDLTSKQSFRAPLEEVEETMDGARDGHHGIYGGYRPLGQPNYYSNSNSYHPHPAYPPHGPQPGVSAGYPPGPAMGGGNFMPQMPPPQIPPREGEYAGFNQSPYSRNYESLHNNMPPSSHPSSIPPTPTSVLPPGYPDRPPSQTHHPALYSQASMQPRAMTAPSPVDTRASGAYDRGYSSMPSVSNPSPIGTTRALEPAIKYEDQRDPQPHPPAAAPYPAERQQYYMSPQGPVHPNSYQPGPPGSPWRNTGAAQRPPI